MDIFSDPLRQKAQQLENEFNKSGAFDPDAWLLVIAEFEDAGRVSGAENLDRKFKHCATLAGKVVA